MVKGLLGVVIRRLTGYDVVRIALGIVLLTAAGLKGHQMATEPVAGTGLLDSRWLLMATVEFELLFGLWLLAGVWPRWTWTAALICFIVFSCVSLCKALSGYASCGCFGRVAVNPWYTAALDLAIVLSLLRWRPFRQECPIGVKSGGFTVRATGVLAVWLSVGVPMAVEMGSYRPATIGEDNLIVGEGNVIMLEPARWIGKRFPLLPFVKDDPGNMRLGERPLRDRLTTGDWTLVLYDGNCPRCRDFLADVRQTFESGMPDSRFGGSLAIIRITAAEAAFLPKSCEAGSLADQYRWFLPSPTACRLRNGLVEDARTKVSRGEI